MVKIKTNCFKLSETRIRLGMSVNELSKAAGVTRQAIYSLEAGIMNPTPATAKKITKTLNIKFDDIFSLVEGE